MTEYKTSEIAWTIESAVRCDCDVIECLLRNARSHIALAPGGLRSTHVAFAVAFESAAIGWASR